MPGDTQRAAATARARSIHPLGIHPLALIFAIAVHLAASVGLWGRFSPRKPDETPITLDLVLAAPTPAENTPTEAPPDLPQPDPPQPEPAPPPPPASPKEVAQAIPPPLPPPKLSATPPRRPHRTIEAPHPHAAPPAHVAPATHDDASAPPAPAPLQQPVSPPLAPAPSTDPAWSSALSGWLQGHRNYPEAARRRGEQGQVGVRFTVSHDGQVQDVTVTRPSGYEALDAAAQTMLQNAHVPAFPASMTQPSITVTVTIRFTLDK